MSCPACGRDDEQRRIGRLWDRPQDLYHCQVCDKLYLAEAESEDEHAEEE